MTVSNGISIATSPLLIPAKTRNWCKELNKLSEHRPSRISMEFHPSLATRWQIKLSPSGPVGLGLHLQPIDRRLRTPSASKGQTRTITLAAPTRTITNAYANEKSLMKKKVEVSASGRNIRMSAHKVRRVVDQIRGRSYEETLMILELMPYRACYPIFKIVYSAAANGIHNLGLNEASLVISKVEVNEGMALKRPRPRARGRSDMIKKPTCHVTIVLKDTSLDE